MRVVNGDHNIYLLCSLGGLFLERSVVLVTLSFVFIWYGVIIGPLVVGTVAKYPICTIFAMLHSTGFAEASPP